MSGSHLVTPPLIQRPVLAELPVDIYANQLRVGATLHDFTLIFGVTEDLGPNQFVSRDKVVIRLSPGMAKTLMLQLVAIVEAYEQGVGKIPVSGKIPEEIAQIKDTLVKVYKEQMEKPRPKP